MNIGFVGAGIMGHGMALNLLAKGFEVAVVAHRNRAPIDDLVAQGAREASSSDDLARTADAVILCVTNSDVARRVVVDLLPGLRPGALVIDTTTHAADAPPDLAATLKAGGARYVEAPVTGGATQAREGKLGAVVGCDLDDLEDARPILAAFCARIERFGPVGAGTRAKLISNFLALGTATLVVETFRQARSLGVDWQKLYDVALLGSGNSAGLQRIVGNALNGDFGGYVFSIDNTLKDLTHIRDLLQADDGLAAALRDVHARAVADGHGSKMLSELLDPSVDRPKV